MRGECVCVCADCPLAWNMNRAHLNLSPSLRWHLWKTSSTSSIRAWWAPTYIAVVAWLISRMQIRASAVYYHHWRTLTSEYKLISSSCVEADVTLTCVKLAVSTGDTHRSAHLNLTVPQLQHTLLRARPSSMFRHLYPGSPHAFQDLGRYSKGYIHILRGAGPDNIIQEYTPNCLHKLVLDNCCIKPRGIHEVL